MFRFLIKRCAPTPQLDRCIRWVRAPRLALAATIGAVLLGAEPAELTAAPPTDAGPRADTIVARYRELLVSKYASRADAWKAERLGEWVASLDPAGAWPDIDYASTAPGSWPTLEHLHRVRIMAREAVDPSSRWHDDETTVDAVLRALDHWTSHRFQNPNWWQNRIGVPQVMRDIIVLLGPRLSESRRRDCMAVLRQVILHGPGEGANTIWTAELGLMASALKRDADGLADTSARIAHEIALGREEGLQDDFSFHQHGARLQQFHYGLAFFRDTVRLAWLLRETPWALPSDRIHLLAEFMLEGNRWMARGQHTVPGTLDRAVSRAGALSGARLTTELRMLSELLPARGGEFDAVRQINETGGPAVVGFRSFPRSDFTTYHRPAFSFFLKTISSRTLPTESIIRENLRGARLGWGDHYLLTDRVNYDDIPPVWDWDLLPGVTAMRRVTSLRPPDFSGAIGEDGAGLTAMEYRLEGDNGSATLTATKFWAMQGDVVVALIGGLTASSDGEPVRTALDQRPLTGAVTIGTRNGQVHSMSEGRHELTDVAWLHHDGLAYLPLYDARLTLSLEHVSGSWQDINLNQSATPVTLPVFLPVLEHGNAPQADAAGFVLAAGTPDETAALAAKPTWVIARNDADCQAVRFSDGVLMAAFYQPGRLEIHGSSVEVDTPCLVLIEGDAVRVSDPTHQGQALRVTVNGRERVLQCPPHGRTSLR